MKNHKTKNFLIIGTVFCALGTVLFASGIAAGGREIYQKYRFKLLITVLFLLRNLIATMHSWKRKKSILSRI